LQRRRAKLLRMKGTETSRLLDKTFAETRAAFIAALSDGDATAASAAYTDDAILLPPAAEPLYGREAIGAFWSAGVEAGISDIELVALELERDGGLAYEIGSYALRLQPVDGDTVVDRGKYLLVHARQADGTWRRAAEMFSPDATN
jgi:ketosteroid isomerase-like protein